MKPLLRNRILASFLVIAATGCEFSINTIKKASLNPPPVDIGWRRPVVPVRAYDVAGEPNLILFSDPRISQANFSTIRDRLATIKNRYPNSFIVLVGGLVSGQATTDAARIAEINLVAQLKNEFPLILDAAFGPGDPLQGTSYDGSRRLCAAIGQGLSQENYLSSTGCANRNTLGRYDRHLGLGTDYDLGSHIRPYLLDVRPISSTGAPTFKYSADYSSTGVVDSTTQLYGACKATFESWFSGYHGFGGTTFEMPPALGTRRSQPLIFAADPFSTKASAFDQNAATALRTYINNSAAASVVFTRMVNLIVGDITGGQGTSAYPAPALIQLGKRSVWQITVGVLNPETMGASLTPAFTAVYMGRNRTLVKVHSATDGGLISTHDLAHFDDGLLNWRTADSSVGKYSMCCQLDQALRPATESGNGTNRLVRYNQIIANTGADECGSIQ